MPETSGAVPSPIGPGPKARWIASWSPAGMLFDEVVAATDGCVAGTVVEGNDSARVMGPI